MQTKLAIAIPTYNRAEILQFNLLQIIDELIEFQIPVYISDDSTNEDTYIVINDLKKKHSLFYYRKNEIRFGHDLNCLNTISFPKEQYVWYMGDSMIIKKGAIKKILDVISVDTYDFISCNGEGRNLDVKSKVFTDANELLELLGWHLTMSGATIYNTISILDLKKELAKYKNFPQLAMIFVKFGLSKSSLYWINDKLVASNKNKKSYWSNGVFDVFLTDFKNFAQNLSEIYPDQQKTKLVLQHSIKTGMFSYHSFVKYRINGVFNFRVFVKYKKDIEKYTDCKYFYLFIIAIFPNRILRFLYNLV